MAGIYIHIPFCKTKCHYCDFYKSTDFQAKSNFLSAMETEIKLRKGELEAASVESIYFGGGTPSVVSSNELEEILNCLRNNFTVEPAAEITLEANPDDLNSEYLSEIKQIGFNRLSIGTQSFSNDDLKRMNRRHSANEAVLSVQNAKKAGFENISIDLIYGLPNQTIEAWENNIKKAIDLDVQHISAYHLTYHEGTVFFDYLKTGKIKELPDEVSFNQFKILKNKLEEAGFEHYEISNFTKDGLYSRHNKSYWEREAYLGFGPSAHSFDLKTRRWNVSSLHQYLDSITEGKRYWEIEHLSEQDQYNDYVITSLRTIWGISVEYLTRNFHVKYAKHFNNEILPFVASTHVKLKKGNYCLTTEGLFISDKIMEKLIYIGDV